jgi:predicted glycogen debranching enzyme
VTDVIELGPGSVADRSREWLVTNGRGSFASGTVAGLRTRRYHGLLVAARRPPVGRVVLASRIAETATVGDETIPLFSVRWRGRDHPIDPAGFQRLERFRLVGSIPEWTYALGAARLSKRVWMEHGADTTYVRFDLARGDEPIRLSVDVFVEHRPFHETTAAGDWTMDVRPIAGGAEVHAFEGATPVVITATAGQVEPRHVWYEGEFLEAEKARGLNATTDTLLAANVSVTVEAGESITLRIGATHGDTDGALDRRRRRDEELVAGHDRAPAWIRRLVLAADQFVVGRSSEGRAGSSIIAGYPWFEDWGRDTMIALPGLLLVTGRHREAAELLSTYAGYVEEGLIPNRFPDGEDTPEYNTVDATLWFVAAVDEYKRATGDRALVRQLWPVLVDIVDHHLQGTRHGIGVDSADGLLCASDPGWQLTWMDAKVGGRVVTPRMGKPVEVNALWYHSLMVMESLAEWLGEAERRFGEAAGRVRRSFQRFWSDELGFCFDVIDGPEGNDPALRPNQLMAVSLRHSPLRPDRMRAVVDICARALFTPVGLRTLGRRDPDYHGRYGGGPVERDDAYHQGTVWPWLLGPFVTAHHRVHGDADLARSFLEAIPIHLAEAGIGSVSEVFDGDPPHVPGGTVAQAWSVAEILRAWHELEPR